MHARHTLNLLAALSLIALAGCGADHGDVGSDDVNGTRGSRGFAEDWPGGSVGGWEAGAGVDEAWTRSDGSGAGGESGDDGAYGGGAEAGADSDGMADEAPGDPGANGAGGLEGGEIDDNADLGAFLEFAESMGAGQEVEGSMVRWLDVSRRHIVTVRDGAGRPVADAVVAIFDASRLVATGRTHADGRFGFFPLAYGSDALVYEVEAWVGERGFASGEVEAGEEGLELRVSGARPATDCRVDVAFFLDATGSMGGEIGRLKPTVASIASSVAESAHGPDLRLALVDYRDRGDQYVAHSINFTPDVEAFQGALDQVQAGGGGDLPEDLNAALHDGMRRLAWRQEPSLRLAFVIADAPAHYYGDATYRYDQAMLDAATMGVGIYPIASGGSDGVAELQFRQLAQFTLSHFIFVTEGGGSSHGSEGSDYHVDGETFDVEALDQLVIRLISENMAMGCVDASRPL